MQETEVKEIEKTVVEPERVEGEIVTTSPNTQIINYDFERVDLDNPQSILSYGQNVQDTIIDTLKSTAQMSVNQEEDFLTDDILRKITSFDESLEAAKREAEKKEGLAKRLAKKVLIAVGVQKVKEQEELKTYQGRYNDYVNNIEMVIEKVEIMKQNALNDINLRKEITEQLKPYIEELSEMIKVGKEDLVNFNNETIKISEEDKSLDGQYLVQRRTQVSDVFTEKLDRLEKVLILYKGQLQEYALQQNNDMTIVMQADSYQRDQAPLLVVQGSTQVFNIAQGERIDTLSALNEASNLAIINNSKNLEMNTKAAVELSINGGFSTDALKAVQTSLQNGIKLVEDGKKKVRDRIAKDQKSLEEINNLLEENNQRLVEMLEETAGALTQIESSNTSINRRTLSPRRPRGKR